MPQPNRTGLGPDHTVRASIALAAATLSPAPGGPSARRIAGGQERAANRAAALGTRAQYTALGDRPQYTALADRALYTVRHKAGTSQAGFTPDRSNSHPPGIGRTPKGRQ